MPLIAQCKFDRKRFQNCFKDFATVLRLLAGRRSSDTLSADKFLCVAGLGNITAKQ